nr:NADH dehydrogenase subunit 2 [Haplotrema minimum]
MDKLLYLVLLIISIIIGVSASDWVLFWVSIEFCLFFFILFNYQSKVLSVSEPCMKYFMVQSVASIFMFISGLMLFYLESDLFLWLGMFIMSCIMKLGLFPFHFWVIPINNNMSYLNMSLLFGPMKILPLIVLEKVINNYMMNSSFSIMIICLIVISSMVTGSILGLNCSKVRSMVSASSISHSGWFLLGILVGSLWLYFVVYILTLFQFLYFLHMDYLLMSFMMCLSLSGLPPFMVFLGKVMVLSKLVLSSTMILTFIIAILSAVISLFFYLKFSYFFYLNNKKMNFSFDLKLKLITIMNLFSSIIILFMI